MIVTAATVLVLAATGPAAAAPAYPAPDGRCVDTTGVLGSDLCSRITAVLRADEDRTGDEIAVAVVPTTGDASIESWATGLFNSWGVGKVGQDNGVLLVVAVDDHRLRIATGRGMTGRLSDDRADQIITTTITPEFRHDRYAAGILAGLDEIRRRLGHPVEPGAELAGLTGAGASPVHGGQAAPAPEPDRDDGGFPWWYLMVAAVPVMAVVIVVTERSLRRVGRVAGPRDTHLPMAGSGGSSSGSSGTGGGFGGGGSDGGGSSGGW
ncbi:hypothetical protein Pme01_19870 [Planosporangium mesophilum]|uniref:TPM domain-containing protein n=2 Tax=Planosporangium mesophilum TaxID=689768 RepID=A0A8J3T8C0_9ACTN|nr:hypothetical protein Pme01_19870 [Planosporangium mesophilum]